mmetsp:Transcript_7497/g.15277  ORF Transcript_7497/g.15277 Transcript_7497/m.15277 type:complete len:215 (-) Transcript_7497:470-1114(-)|eukprot:CAMPEP_0184678520 /NCGR_PEP_ID=MMETSP0312-20130426/1280_1 /TAXON_ID=31354 /ORGANISM="Compsopogon coeruleus, Strain SAG 36.94" /LENGTH=214 /DNA_ID=CAMNT_0027127333 /DNA_START=404 /DNA_END=1048 /DNA_ORIENTATION=+
MSTPKRSQIGGRENYHLRRRSRATGEDQGARSGFRQSGAQGTPSPSTDHLKRQRRVGVETVCLVHRLSENRSLSGKEARMHAKISIGVSVCSKHHREQHFTLPKPCSETTSDRRSSGTEGSRNSTSPSLVPRPIPWGARVLAPSPIPNGLLGLLAEKRPSLLQICSRPGSITQHSKNDRDDVNREEHCPVCENSRNHRTGYHWALLGLLNEFGS